jgi:hypothetical protein
VGNRLVRFYDFAEGAMADARSGKTIKLVLRIGNQPCGSTSTVNVQ